MIEFQYEYGVYSASKYNWWFTMEMSRSTKEWIFYGYIMNNTVNTLKWQFNLGMNEEKALEKANDKASTIIRNWEKLQ